MKPSNRRIILNTLHILSKESVIKINEQQEETSNNFSIYSDGEQKFLGQFDKVQDTHLGVIYSLTDIGVREFMSRSGAQLQCTAGILLGLIKKGVIKIVPSGGYGNDTTYTIELQLTLKDVTGMAEKAEAAAVDAAGGGEAADAGGGDVGGGIGGGAMPGPPAGGGEEEPPPDLEGEPMESVVNYKDIINESVKIARRLVNERSSKKKTINSTKDVKLHQSKTRIFNRVPQGFTRELKRVIVSMNKKTFNKLDQERLIADILDILQLNFNLTDAQIRRSYEFHRNQNRLQKYLEK